MRRAYGRGLVQEPCRNMRLLPVRRHFLRTGLVLGAACALRPAQACEYQADYLRVTHPWTRATNADATTAVLCMRLDEVTESDRLIAVETPVATGAEMGVAESGRAVDLAVPKGSVIDMHDAGLHLRLTGLRHPLQVGREYALRLDFERSGTVLARLSVDFPTMRFR